jgi:hypothetical protein
MRTAGRLWRPLENSRSTKKSVCWLLKTEHRHEYTFRADPSQEGSSHHAIACTYIRKHWLQWQLQLQLILDVLHVAGVADGEPGERYLGLVHGPFVVRRRVRAPGVALVECARAVLEVASVDVLGVVVTVAVEGGHAADVVVVTAGVSGLGSLVERGDVLGVVVPVLAEGRHAAEAVVVLLLVILAAWANSVGVYGSAACKGR